MDLIESYQRKIDNLKYHLETNGWNVNELQRAVINQRIDDYTEFIYHLKNIKTWKN